MSKQPQMAQSIFFDQYREKMVDFFRRGRGKWEMTVSLFWRFFVFLPFGALVVGLFEIVLGAVCFFWGPLGGFKITVKKKNKRAGNFFYRQKKRGDSKSRQLPAR